MRRAANIPETDDGCEFDPHVLKAELKQVQLRRISRGQASPSSAPGARQDEKGSALDEARDARLAGLALSGGGIRSATFNLGLLQGLAQLGVLRRIDYLSTVSGGGYIGGWLSAWIRRQEDFDAVEQRLANGDKAVAGDAAPREPINHLRRYSNYLAPRQGFLSADRWVLWADYLRNFLLNLMVLLPLLIILLLCVRFFMWLYYPWSQNVEDPGKDSLLAMKILAGVGVACLVSSLVGLFYAARMVTGRNVFVESYDHSRWTGQRILVPVLGLVALSFIFCSFVPYDPATIVSEALPSGILQFLSDRSWEVSFTDWVIELIWFSLCTTVAGLLCYTLSRVIPPQGNEPIAWWDIVAVTGASLAAGPLLYGVFNVLHSSFVWDGSTPEAYLRASATAWSLTVGPPMVLLALVLIMSIGVGLLKERIREELKEWWASICGRLMFFAAWWLAFFVIALYAAPFVLWSGPYVRAFLTSGWVITVLAGVFAGGSAKTSVSASRHRLLELIAWLGPYLFLAGLLVGVSVLLHNAVDRVPLWQNANEDVWVRRLEPPVPPVTDILARTSNASKDLAGKDLIHESAQDKGEDKESPDDVKETRSVEHREVVSTDEIYKQMYWVGLLNIDRNFVPHVVSYDLGKAVEYYNETRERDKRKPYHDIRERDKGQAILDITKVQPSWAPEGLYTYDKNGFNKAVARLLKFLADKSPRTRYLLRFQLTQWAKQVQLWSGQTGEGKTAFAAKLGTWILCVGLVMFLAMWRVDVNLMSLQNVYGNRLVRCYLGASRPIDGQRACRKRQPDPITGFDPNDDLYLDELQQNEVPVPGQPIDPTKGRPYTGPYLIVNASLNLVHGGRLDWQERKAESFILTPRFCGSSGTCYRRTDPDPTSGNAYGGRLWLGNAVTISGAAASPNMGYHSSTAITALLTVFNARLGSWLGNPGHAATWHRTGPRLGFLHLFRELFGLTSAKGEYIFLSDGGHFENLGVYELVRRRCQYIIVSDAGNDAEHSFEDLSKLIHKCRVDFGIEIDIRPESLHPDERGLCSWHCAVGQIRYDLVDPSASPGILVYVKPSLTGDEPTDVLQYRRRNAAFPHDPTTNQFFTETRFESYRALGEHVAKEVFGRAIDAMKDDLAQDKKTGITRIEDVALEHRRWCLDFFACLVRHWYSLPVKYESSFLDSTKEFIEVQTALRTEPNLWRLSLQIYPELDPNGVKLQQARPEDPEQVIARHCAETHVIIQMLQVMENAWLSLNLEDHYAHPLNRGWLDVFRRWTSAPTVRRLWPTLRAEFNRGFAAFCDKQMGLGGVEADIWPIKRGTKPADWDRFLMELRSDVPRSREGMVNGNPLWDWPKWLEDARRHAERSDDKQPLGWYVFPNKLADAAAVADNVPCGIILLNQLSKKGTFELFVWMRGAYRNSGLGRLALRDVLHKQLKNRKDVDCLRAHLRHLDGKGPTAQLQESMWLTFFYHHGFVRAPEDEADCTVLEWTKLSGASR